MLHFHLSPKYMDFQCRKRSGIYLVISELNLVDHTGQDLQFKLHEGLQKLDLP